MRYWSIVPSSFVRVAFVVGWGVIGCVLSVELPAQSDSAAAKVIRTNPSDWPWWRGPNFDGVAASDQNPPIRWNKNENVVWKTPIEGRGHGSITVVGSRAFLATADLDRNAQSVVCLDRATGKVRWQTDVHRQGVVAAGNAKTTLASCTVACDGERLFANFLNNGAVHLTALNLDGELLWTTKITDFVVHQGFGASPAVYGSLVIVSADNKGSGAIVAADRKTGQIVWRVDRPKVPNYTSPIILNVAGKTQLLFTGCDLVTSLDPQTGAKLWEISGATTECVTSTVSDGELIFTSGGYPKNHMSAVRGDGSGTVVWENKSRVYVPSMLVLNGHLYAVMDEGIAVCYQSSSGQEVWRGRLGGKFSSSPVLVGDRIFVTNETGTTYVFHARPDRFTLIGENQLGDEVFATPTICNSQVFMRVAEMVEGKRQESVYCLANKSS